jgi:hypothetical protein
MAGILRPPRCSLVYRVKDYVFRNVNENYVNDYASLVRSMIRRTEPDFKVFPGVTPGFDNSPRRSRDYFILEDSSPELYQDWLEFAISSALRKFDREERIVFINAWNEWAEGNHLEPDQRWGRQYLESTRAAVEAMCL